MSIKFSIGQVSKLYEVSIDTLRYYGKIGLLNPIINNDNGYRYYGLNELEQLELILRARNLEIPIKDIIKTIESEQISEYMELMNRQETLISERITSLIKLQDNIEQNKIILHKIQNHKNIINFKSIEPYQQELTFIQISINKLLVKEDYKEYLELIDEAIVRDEYFVSYSITSENIIVEDASAIYILVNDTNKKVLENVIKTNNLIIETINISGKFIKSNFYGDIGSFNQYIKDINAYFTGRENTSIYTKYYFFLPRKESNKYYCEIILKI